MQQYSEGKVKLGTCFLVEGMSDILSKKSLLEFEAAQFPPWQC